ncbi:uncharacterized protein LOC106760541 [Vigna radiata var. radiata]|uniref:Uncharacterized protein LOC106760541 n=1 Tax=Vigna radiata var. radiata TaxID=3916 RepID=A0A1S3U0B2_VIGRR|nr:uncharacterized protein LOC106760541 [Vigna radiata var. radiata]
MNAESNFSQIAPPVFDGESYDLWAVKMETYLEVLDLWEAVEEEYEVLPLPENPTMAQIKIHKERKTRKAKVIVLEKYEAFIAYLENTRDLSKITFAEVLHAFQAQEQRSLMRKDHAVEDVGKDLTVNAPSAINLDMKLSYAKTKINKEEEAKVADQEEEEDLLFVATCHLSIESSESWLIDNGCTNHMTFNKALSKDVRPTDVTKARIGNGDYISVKGKGTVAITSCADTKFIPDALFVPEIDQNLLSVGELIEREFRVIFEDKNCLIKDAAGQDMFKVKMKGKSFPLKQLKEEQTIFKENVTEI